MPFLDLLMLVLTLALGLLTLPGTIYLLVLSVAALRKPSTAKGAMPLNGAVALVVPAHNESTGMVRTLDNLLKMAKADGAAQLVVVADNCTDDTAQVARSYGARVLERHDPHHRGKGYALDFAFTTLMDEPFEAFVVIDADTVADANFLTEIRRHLGAGAQALQTRYTVLDAKESPSSQLAELALMGWNVLRPRGRSALGWSCSILGNGFVLSRDALMQVPYSATSVVEDFEYHVRLLQAGLKVDFVDGTTVRGAMPSNANGRANQRARWEGGRLNLLLTQGGSLLSASLRGQTRLLEPLLDLLLLPLAYQAVLLAVLLALPNPLSMVLGSAGWAVLFFHVLVAAHLGQLGAFRLLRTLLQVPQYLLWKLLMLRRTLGNAHSAAAWVRTDRDQKH